jgi:hypothetical protein
MFNWYTAPTFAATLLFWLLAAYVLTRGRRDAVSLAAVAAVGSTAAYLLGEAMEANAPGPDEWRSWARGLRWGATVAVAAWYWLTALLLRAPEAPAARQYLQWVGYPLGLLFAVGGLVFTAAIYFDDWLWLWSAAPQELTDEPAYLRYYAPAGPLFSPFIAFVAAAALGTAVNLTLACCVPSGAGGRRRFAWLLLGAVLFIPEVGSLIAYQWFRVALPTWLNHLALAAAMALMAANVTAYHHLRHGQTIRVDLLYFVTTWTLICVTFAAIFLVAGGGYSFQLLGLLALTLGLAILSHGLIDPARRALDRLFFGREVQRLRSNLTSVVQDAALTPDQYLGALLSQARTELEEVSAAHLARLTQAALRCLNAPAALADCGLAERLPRTIAAFYRSSMGLTNQLAEGAPMLSVPTPLEKARALRTALVEAVERLKPADEGDPGAPAALQYHILHDEYVLGRPNKQIMTRRGISEGTFHRNRREAVAILSRELARQEERLPSG